LTHGGRIALFPRWLGDTALIYSAAKGREMPAAYTVSLGGRETKVGRRNGVDANVRLPDGGILFTQPDYLDPYHLRQDLYVQRGQDQIRLTRGARLSAIDARADGEIVAVQDVPATTRLVRVSTSGKTITPITQSSIDTQWMDPQWSPDGTRIVAIEQTRGVSQLTVLDPDGARLMSFGASRAITSEPSWSSDGQRIYFTSERNGMPQIYVADMSGGAVKLARLTDAATGVFSPEASPDRTKLAATLFLSDGYHIGVAPIPIGASSPAVDSSHVSPRQGCADCLDTVPGLAALGSADSSPATRYSPWISLLPRYWLPVFASTTEDGTSFGAETSGYDIVGRHSYTAEVLRNNRFHENSGWLWYTYAGFGLPLIDLYASQNFSNGDVPQIIGGVRSSLGTLIERERIASLQATYVRPRFRTYSFASIGGEIDNLSWATAPVDLLTRLNPFFTIPRTLPAIIASAGWSNAQRPALSISPEDGISASLNGRQRWQRGTAGSGTRSLVGISSIYKSLDLPGFAHHVLAVRAAGGVEDERALDTFSAGGLSGGSLDVFPGVTAGQERRTFGVRGYPVSSEKGIRAYSGSVEYRAPLTAPSQGFRFIPVFIDKTSFTVFGDAGRAYCPTGSVRAGTICELSDVQNPVMSSVGAELNIDTGILLDQQARVRLGIAFPLANRELLKAGRTQFYATFGSSF
jgi:hypothetical protein